MQDWKEKIRRGREKLTSSRGRTLVEIVGKNRLVIERHLGIQCYGTEEILVRSTYGHLRICGSALRLCCMSREQLCITGNVDTVEFLGRSERGSVE